jgi:hypothetical protein
VYDRDMSDDPHASDAMTGPHGADDHGEDHGQALGSVDVTAWGAGLLGIAAGLVVAVCMAASAGWLG